MSFSIQVKNELNSIQIKKNCCKRSYLLGAVMAANNINQDIILTVSDKSTIEKICFFLKSIFNIIPEQKIIKRGCFNATELKFRSTKLAEFLENTDSFSKTPDNTEKLLSFFSCPNCQSAFLRAVFCTKGSVSDPKKSYTFELQTPIKNRAEAICCIIENSGLNTPNVTKRNKGYGLFYRNESSIEDYLSSCGANHALFTFFDTHIEKNIRNSENRATNCVANNILRSVEVIQLQISAIEKLKECGIFDEFSKEIKNSAELRLENPEATLSELALIHDPPISKSGLNHRLTKIVDEAKKLKLI